MRRIIKHPDSEIITNQLNYPKNSSTISKILYKEQKGFCTYTEEFIGRADAKDIEHFNPNLKSNAEDGYSNWFLVKHQWNSEKASKWSDTILHPTDPSFETRIVYDNGDYRVADSTDIEAINLIKLIKLDDPILADERKRYIKRKSNEIEIYKVSNEDFFKILIEDDIKQISYLRAIQEEFKINIWDLIPQQ